MLSKSLELLFKFTNDFVLFSFLWLRKTKRSGDIPLIILTSSVEESWGQGSRDLLSTQQNEHRRIP